MARQQLRWDDKRDARRFQRVPVPADATATLVSSALGRVTVRLADLSQGGARATTAVRCAAGDRFVLRLPGLGPRAVTVAWADGGEVGLSFAEPISWQVVSALALGE